MALYITFRKKVTHFEISRYLYYKVLDKICDDLSQQTYNMESKIIESGKSWDFYKYLEENLYKDEFQKGVISSIFKEETEITDTNISFKSCLKVEQLFIPDTEKGRKIEVISIWESPKYVYISMSYDNGNPIIICADIKNGGEFNFMNINALKEKNINVFLC